MVYENIIYTQKTLAERYGISIAALQHWYPYAGIVKPQKRGGYFDAATVEIADIFYVAIKIRRLTCKEYLQQVIPVGGLDTYLQKVNNMTLYDFLTKHISEAEKNNPIVQTVIRRLERHEAYKSVSTTIAGVT
jgi:DNA-binding transcriptional MerR regulator